MQIPRRRSEKFQKPDDGPIYLTPQGFEDLKATLAHLKKVLPGYIAEAQRTAAYGDRSDNAEYKQAKGTLRRTNYRILEIEDQLKRVSIIPVGKNNSGIVSLGSTVTLELRGGERRAFQILGSHETNPSGGRISQESPLGSALLNKKVGETVVVKEMEYRIVDIT
jgi:transcription elongation GreA/GreB family factor